MTGRSSGKPVKHRSDREDVEIGQRIRAVRVARCVSQNSLGTSLGVSFQQVQKYERGVNRVSAGRLQKIAEMLETPVMFFYGEPGPRKKQDQDNGFALLQSKDAIRLLRAFGEISSGATKHALVLLAEKLRD
jgi:transcriptional regulator with XRE-family HTH domain